MMENIIIEELDQDLDDTNHIDEPERDQKLSTNSEINSSEEVNSAQEDEEDKFYENFFLQFGLGYISSRFVLNMSIISALSSAILFVLIVRTSIFFLKKWIKKSGKELEKFYLSPLALEGYLLTDKRSVNIEFNDEDSYFKVIVE